MNFKVIYNTSLSISVLFFKLLYLKYICIYVFDNLDLLGTIILYWKSIPVEQRLKLKKVECDDRRLM